MDSEHEFSARQLRWEPRDADHTEVKTAEADSTRMDPDRNQYTHSPAIAGDDSAAGVSRRSDALRKHVIGVRHPKRDTAARRQHTANADTVAEVVEHDWD